MSAILKRVLDVVLSVVALVVLSPILSLAALGVWLSDRTPILYRARLTGRNGRPFTMYKLRTMRVNHGAFRSVITADQDPRVFRFGAWLRRAKVDELPQLLNILRGEMSIVGPRPEHGYVERLLPLRLALDLVYVRRASLAYDAALVGRTVQMIAATVLGRGASGDPPELIQARRLLARRTVAAQL